jgi:RsiW-degrading membrane proteinase PrsW (M82 family)
VLAFLTALVLLDSYKLVRPGRVAKLLLWGGCAAALSLVANPVLATALDIEPSAVVRYQAPIVEELLKGAAVAVLLARRRVGFLVDASIMGFAVGAGFAAVENLHYFLVLEDPNLLLWVVRGFGTAVMHGSVTAVMAILGKLLADRLGATKPWVTLPGWLLAIALHSLFNHFLVSPRVTTVLMLFFLPAFFVVIFELSERVTRDWLGVGFDSDAELLQLIHSGKISQDRIGRYLEELKERFPATTVADILCLLRVRLELSIRAKGILLMRQAGFEPPPDPELEAQFAELQYLERSIGATGLLAMAPFFHFSDRDLWQHHLLTGR